MKKRNEKIIKIPLSYDISFIEWDIKSWEVFTNYLWKDEKIIIREFREKITWRWEIVFRGITYQLKPSYFKTSLAFAIPIEEIIHWILYKPITLVIKKKGLTKYLYIEHSHFYKDWVAATS